MRLSPAIALLLLLSSHAVHAFVPDDFRGRWVVDRMIGFGRVVAGTDYRKLLKTKVFWDEAEVRSADGTCKIAQAALAPLANAVIEQDVFAGQRIAELKLSGRQIAAAFGKTETPVFDDGDRRCAIAIMIDRSHIIYLFSNNYIYLLTRDTR